MNNSQAMNVMMSFYKSETGEPTTIGAQTGFRQEALSR
jgi:hypothetical protein